MERVYDVAKNCCGCSLCAEVCPKDAIDMVESEGFVFPVINQEKCIDCGLCLKSCRFQNFVKEERNPECFAARINDNGIRLKSSSGGAFTVASDIIFSRGGAVCGAVFGEDMKVCHIVARTAHERDEMRGAKYVQSDLSLAYSQMEAVLKEGRDLLFSGTPCQVAAVKKRFAKYDSQLYTIDLICHGVPAVSVWNNYIKYIQKVYKKKVTGFTFRDKTKSWREYHAVVTFEDGSIVSDTPAVDSYVELFRYDLALRSACSNCPYASTHRQGDITIGDFWGIQNHFPEMDDDRGVSAVMFNTEKGKSLIEAFKERMWLTSCSVDQIAARQPNMSCPSKPSVKKTQFEKDLKELPFDKLLKKYTAVGLKRRVINLIKKLLNKQ